MRGVLVLQDGTVVEGDAFGSEATAFGELVFNTNMTGYCEALTDPSYRGQILMMTYPLIGNYGVDPTTFESPLIQPRAFVVRELCREPSHPTSRQTLHEFLETHGIPGISAVDTRMLTVKTRVHGTLRAALSTEGAPPEELLEEVTRMPYPDSGNLVEEVSTDSVVKYENGGSLTVVLVDCGVKGSIISNLLRFANVVRVPYDTPADAILDLGPDGVLVSNGPGDPAHPDIISTTASALLEYSTEVPVMGICLGHQIMGLAFGGRTFKLKFGHRGGNQPVRSLADNRIRMTSQNHGFAVDPDLPGELVATEVNQNDGTLEGLAHADLPVFSHQYHPEAAPGPHDAQDHFLRFKKLMEANARA